MLAANADEGLVRFISAFYCGRPGGRGRHVLAPALAPATTPCDAAKPAARSPARAEAGGESVTLLRPSGNETTFLELKESCFLVQPSPFLARIECCPH